MDLASVIYGSLFLVLSGWLTLRHVYNPNASTRSKRVVMIVGAVMLFLYFWSGLSSLAVIVGTAIGSYIILHQLVTSSREQTEHDSASRRD
jgi:Na+/H+ antiporter NhaB